MFGPTKAAHAYARVDLESRVISADPHELVLMLFDGALLAVGHAETHLAKRDAAGKAKAVSRAIAIIEDGLRASLDTTQGGELAGRLDDLYEYMAQRLLLASVKGDLAGFAEVKRLLGELKEAWAAIRRTGSNPPPAHLNVVKGGKP